jgi:hypothetical protein
MNRRGRRVTAGNLGSINRDYGRDWASGIPMSAWHSVVDLPPISGCPLNALAHSVESFLGDEDTACFVVGICVECLAGHPFKYISISFKHLVVSSLEVSTIGVNAQRLVADPAEHKASYFIRHPELNTASSGDPMVIF